MVKARAAAKEARAAPVFTHTYEGMMGAAAFPIGKWGKVVSSAPAAPRLERVRIERSAPGGFLIITKEAKGTFDNWVETQAEVMEFLAPITVDWGA